jgi:hypothetical protein
LLWCCGSRFLSASRFRAARQRRVQLVRGDVQELVARPHRLAPFPAGPPRRPAARALLLDEARLLERDGRLGRQQLEHGEARRREQAGQGPVLQVHQPHHLGAVAHRQAQHRARPDRSTYSSRRTAPGRGVVQDHPLAGARDVLDQAAGRSGTAAVRRRVSTSCARPAPAPPPRCAGSRRGQEHAGPRGPALLQHHLHQPGQQAPQLHLAGDRLGGLHHRQQVQLLGAGEPCRSRAGRSCGKDRVELGHLAAGAPAGVGVAGQAQPGVGQLVAAPGSEESRPLARGPAPRRAGGRRRGPSARSRRTGAPPARPPGEAGHLGRDQLEVRAEAARVDRRPAPQPQLVLADLESARSRARSGGCSGPAPPG